MADNSPDTLASVAAPEDDEISVLDLLLVIVDNLRLLIILPLLAGLVALGITFLIAPTFTATARFMPPLQQQSSTTAMLQSLGALGGLAGAASGIKNPNDQFVAFLTSESITNSLIERFKLVERYETKFKVDARLELRARSQIAAGKDSLITISVGDTDPAFAAQLANAYIEELGLMLKRIAISESQQRRVFFEKQLAQTKDKLTLAEQALRSTGVNSSALKSSPEVSIRAVAELQARIAAQEIKLSSMRGYLTESAPDFKLAQAELSALRDQASKAESSKLTVSATSSDANYIARLRDVKYFETLFELFARQYEVAKADEAREGTLIQVVDLAMPPEKKSKPKQGAIAALTALSVGILTLLFVFFRQTVKGAKQVPLASEKMNRLRRSWAKALGRA